LPFLRIVGLGLCVVDHLYVVDRLTWREPRLRYDASRVAVGGMTANALRQAAYLGCNAHVLSMVGDDAGGRFVRRALASAGVGTRRLLRVAELPTTVAVVLVERRSGDRRFLVPDRRVLERRAPDFDLSAIDGHTLLLIDGHFPVQARRAVERARQVGARVMADFHRVTPTANALLPSVDYPVVPEEFARVYGDGDVRRAVRRLRERFGGTPVVTQGARGGLYWDGARIRRYRARRVKVVDTTGAGDVFHGALAAGLYRGRSLASSLELAARAAGRACTARGGGARLRRR
jgi:sulfofructose kinase